MAWDNQGWQVDPNAAAPGANQVLVEESARAYMARVYRWMFGGLAITGAVALYTATNPALLNFVYGIQWALFVAELVLVLALTWAAPKMSGAAAAMMFIAYAAMNGLLFSFLFIVYKLGSIGESFLLTAGVFGALSIYGTVTKKDLSAWRTFLFMGLIGVVIASVVNIFTKSGMVAWVISAAAVVVFTGLTAYDTQRLRRMATAGAGVAALPVNGALALYLDFINLFLSLLNLFGGRRN